MIEAEVVRKIRAGDSTAFEEIYKTYRRFVYNRCLQLSRNPSIAEDLSQEVFLQVWRKISGFRGESTVKTWIYRVATNTTLMHMRKNRVRKALTIFPKLGNETATVENLPAISDSHLDDCLLFHELLPMLSPAHRRAVILHDLEGYKHREICEILHIPAGTSRSNLNRGRNRIRSILRTLIHPGKQRKFASRLS